MMVDSAVSEMMMVRRHALFFFQDFIKLGQISMASYTHDFAALEHYSGPVLNECIDHVRA